MLLPLTTLRPPSLRQSTSRANCQQASRHIAVARSETKLGSLIWTHACFPPCSFFSAVPWLPAKNPAFQHLRPFASPDSVSSQVKAKQVDS